MGRSSAWWLGRSKSTALWGHRTALGGRLNCALNCAHSHTTNVQLFANVPHNSRASTPRPRSQPGRLLMRSRGERTHKERARDGLGGSDGPPRRGNDTHRSRTDGPGAYLPPAICMDTSTVIPTHTCLGTNEPLYSCQTILASAYVRTSVHCAASLSLRDTDPCPWLTSLSSPPLALLGLGWRRYGSQHYFPGPRRCVFRPCARTMTMTHASAQWDH